MNRFVTTMPVTLLACAAAAVVAAEIESGIPVGGKAGAYSVTDVTGPRQGKSLCYR